MARSALKAGEYRVTPKGGQFLVSGVRPGGQRVKLYANSQQEADSLVGTLFPKRSVTVTAPDWSETDDWGIPLRVTESVVADIGTKLGINNLPGPIGTNGTNGLPHIPRIEGANPALAAPVKVDPVEVIKKAKLAGQAHSLAETIGLGMGWAVVNGGKKICERVDKIPPRANPDQVNALVDNTSATFKDMFGDREVKPWQMMILLGLSIPLSMLMQAKDKEQPPKLVESKPQQVPQPVTKS